MDTITKTVTLEDEPADMTVDTDRGPVAFHVTPHRGPGIYTLTVNITWATDPTVQLDDGPTIPESGNYYIVG